MEGAFIETEQVIDMLQTIIHTIPDDVAVIDRERNIILSNREDFSSGKCYNVLFGRETPCQNCRLNYAIKHKTPVTLEFRHVDSYYQVQAVPIFDKAHEVKSVMEYYRDITKEKEIEQQLLQADKMASLGLLVSGIGHEINNPNQFIKGNVKIVKQALEDLLPIVDKYYETHPELKIARLPYSFLREHIMILVNDMARGSERIKNIVESLKRFARHDEGLLIDTVDINTIINESARLIHKQVNKTASIHLDFEENIPTFIGNSQKIEQIIINLVINASQAMEDGKKGNIWIRTFQKEKHILVEIQDDAGGIKEKDLKKIFDPFFTTKRNKGGTGLGLSIVYRIIEEHGGSILVDSKVNEGTKFTIRFPKNEGKKL